MSRNVFNYLKEKNIAISSLPQSIQTELSRFHQMVNAYNESLQAFNEDEEATEEDEIELQNTFEELSSRSDELIEDVEEFLSEGNHSKSGKKTSVGWLIFGAAALVLTLGAANVFKKE